MNRSVEPALGLKSSDAVQRRLRAVFGDPPTQRGEPSRCYRMAVTVVLRQRYGTPTPAALMSLIDDAGHIGVHPDDFVRFIARQFKLNPMPQFATLEKPTLG